MISLSNHRELGQALAKAACLAHLVANFVVTDNPIERSEDRRKSRLFRVEIADCTFYTLIFWLYNSRSLPRCATCYVLSSLSLYDVRVRPHQAVFNPFDGDPEPFPGFNYFARPCVGCGSVLVDVSFGVE